MLVRGAAGIAYEFLGVRDARACPELARRASSRRCGAPRRADPGRGRPRRGDGARGRRDGAPLRRARPGRADDDRAAAAARRVRPRPGRAALRAAPACAHRRGVGVKRAFDIIVSVLVVVVGLPLWLLIALAIKLDSRGPVFYVDRRDRRRGARVRDAQVPDDGAGAAGCRRSSRRGTRRRARSSRSATTRASRASAGCCGGCRSTSCRR